MGSWYLREQEQVGLKTARGELRLGVQSAWGAQHRFWMKAQGYGVLPWLSPEGTVRDPRVPWPGVQNRPPPAVSVELLLRTVHFSAPRTPAVFTWPGHLNQSHLPFPHARVPSHLGHSARTIFFSASLLPGGASATKHAAGPPPWTRWCGTGHQCRAVQEPGLV